jgi:hypothetical protein
MAATYGSRRHPSRDPVTTPARGRVIRTPVTMATVPVHATERIGTAMMASLGIAINTRSPMSNGNGGVVSMNTGAGIVGRDARRTGALQDWRGLHAPVARPRSVKVGAQGGPGSQPAYPSTGTTGVPSIYSSLALMGLPQALPVV